LREEFLLAQFLETEHTPLRAVDSMTHPDWLDSPEAKQAKRVAGWPDCTPQQFLSALALVLDAIEAGATVLDQALAERGLTYGEFCKIVADVQDDNATSVKKSVHERYGIRRLFLGGFDPGQIASILNLPEVDVVEYVTNQRMLESGREIVRLHAEGLTPAQIAKRLHVGHPMVRKALQDLGQKPNVARTFLSDAQRARIVDLYRAGLSYTDIAAEVRCARSKIANVLRAAHRDGLLPEYGSKAEQFGNKRVPA
jgi:DNA-binding NarL/FixJ family response regulator